MVAVSFRVSLGQFRATRLQRTARDLALTWATSIICRVALALGYQTLAPGPEVALPSVSAGSESSFASEGITSEARMRLNSGKDHHEQATHQTEQAS